MAFEFDLGEGMILELDFAADTDARRVREWNDYVRSEEANPRVLDALELADLALRRWREAKARRRAARSLEEIKDFIVNESKAEVAALLVARPLWMKSRKFAVLGLCHFRRTWCNNICLDYLAAHPLIVRRPHEPTKDLPKAIRGVGLALFYYMCLLARELGSQTIWGEATQNSAPIYRRWFQRNDISDLIQLGEADFKTFMDWTEEKRRSTGSSRV
jgi:hypothetical protein